LQWNEYDFIGCLAVEPVVEEDQDSHEFAVHAAGVVLRLTVWQYESVVQISLCLESSPRPLIEVVVFVRDCAIARERADDEWLELRDCILAGSRFSYIQMGNVFDRRRYPYGYQVRIRVRPQIEVEIVRM
jgi:hypothetical protein